MADSIFSRVKRSWNVFFNRDPTEIKDYSYGVVSSSPPDIPVKRSVRTERSIVDAIFNRISIDVADIDLKHVRLDEKKRYLEDIDSSLNRCLTLEANIDQNAQNFKQDIVLTMLGEGHAVIVPVETDKNPNTTSSYEIESMRVGTVKQWMPQHVRVDLYNERTGNHEEVVVHKRNCAIVTNPLYSIVNENNSNFKRLVRKISLLDRMDEQIGSNRFDIIIQLPYTVKGELREKQASNRIASIERQLVGSKYGVGYIDASEKVTQLNRPVENTLLNQVQYLTEQVKGEIGISQEILNGTANDQAMTNYMRRIVVPIVNAIVLEFNRKFINDDARSQNQAVMFFNNPFKFIPAEKFGELSDSLNRNEICTSNEIRQIIGMVPSKDPDADVLRNKNLNANDTGKVTNINTQPEEEIQNE